MYTGIATRLEDGTPDTTPLDRIGRYTTEQQSAPALSDESDASIAAKWSVWLKDEYDLTVAALGELGIGETDGIPPLEPIRDALILPQHTSWLGARAAIGDDDELLLSPRVQDFGLVGTKSEPGLKRRYDLKQRWLFASHVGGLWKDMDDKDPLHDNYAIEAFQAGILLGDIADDPLDTDSKTTGSGAGLVYVNESFDQMRKLFNQEQFQEAVKGRQLRLMTVADFIVSAAKRRLAGRPRLGELTALVHYPDSVVESTLVDARSQKERSIQHLQVPTVVAPSMGGGSLMIESSPNPIGMRRVLKLATART